MALLSGTRATPSSWSLGTGSTTHSEDADPILAPGDEMLGEGVVARDVPTGDIEFLHTVKDDLREMAVVQQDGRCGGIFHCLVRGRCPVQGYEMTLRKCLLKCQKLLGSCPGNIPFGARQEKQTPDKDRDHTACFLF